MRAADKSPGTIRSYLDSVRVLALFLSERGLPVEVEAVEAAGVRAFLDDSTATTSAGNAHKHFRNLRVFFNWVIAEEERTAGTPMEGIDPPKVGHRPAELLSERELETLLEVCSGGSWVDRRDTAIVRVLMDNGMRLSWLAGLRYCGGNEQQAPDEQAQDEQVGDVWLGRGLLRVLRGQSSPQDGGGQDVYLAPIGSRTAAAIDRYVRARARHPHAASPWLWLPVRGITAEGGERRLTATGIQQMLERRGREAGIAGRLHPHRFRQTMADGYLEAGGDPGELMRIAGWKSAEVVRRYAEAAARSE
ncbi:tyrosine-type recombinase/integrase [Nonomuraea rhizosphaerae]|uniref:tyrosine-type recombinase/integrase n=1 Tax=Nonomuraea rhizosphaerae TaxID=2665663 RepID=UPI001C605EA3|nr:tyrosine-type recombinase/integrase [Nonomuraea rhizosphaerae]